MISGLELFNRLNATAANSRVLGILAEVEGAGFGRRVPSLLPAAAATLAHTAAVDDELAQEGVGAAGEEDDADAEGRSGAVKLRLPAPGVPWTGHGDGHWSRGCPVGCELPASVDEHRARLSAFLHPFPEPLTSTLNPKL